MLRLDATTRSLEVVLGGAVSTTEAALLANWADGATSSYTGGATPGVTSGATPVTLVAAPSSGLVRDVDYVSVRNQDTAEVTATVRYNDNSTIYPIIAATLAVGDQLVYTHASGWSVFRLDGSVKSGTTGAQGDPGATGATGATGAAGPVGPSLLDLDDFEEPGTALSYCGAGVAVTPSGGGSGAWGGITGTLSDQTDLQTALINLYAYAAANG